MFAFLKPEHISLMSTMLTVVGSLTACIRYLIKVNWKLKLEADKAKDELATMRIADLKRAIEDHQLSLDNHATKMEIFEQKIAEFSKRLDANRDSADAAVSSLRAFVDATENRFKDIEKKINFGSVTVKP